MAGFYQDAKSNVKENLRDAFEDRTGILGETIRKRREAQERQQEIQQEVAQINQATTIVRKTGGTLSSLELSFTQISENLQSIAKSLNAQVTTFDETQAVVRGPQVTQQKAPPQLTEKINKDKDDDTSMFDKLDGLLDLLKRGPKGKGKGRGKGGRGKGRTGKLGRAGRLAKLSKFAKLGGRILGPVGLILGTYEALEYLKEVKWAERLAKGEAKLAEQAFKNKKTDFSHIELTQQQAMDILSQPDSPGKTRDIASYGGLARLQQIAGIKTRSMGAQLRPMSGSQSGGVPDNWSWSDITPEKEGRATVKDERWLELEIQQESEADKIRAKLTPSQLKWLGDADPTDETIMARMPAPLPSEVAVQVAAPPPAAKPPAPPVAAKPTVPPPVAAPVDQTDAESKRLARIGKPPTAPGTDQKQTTPVTKPPVAGKKPPQPETGVINLIRSALEQFGITNRFAQAAVLANVEKESGFVPQSENLKLWAGAKNNDRFRFVFPTATKGRSDEELTAIRKDEASFGEFVYGKTTAIGQGMGNTQDGEGYKYRGRGFIQITGKKNYAFYGKLIGEDLIGNPDRANDPWVAAKIAAAFISTGLKNKLNFASLSEANRAITQAIGGARLNLNVGIGASILEKVEKFSGKFINETSPIVAGAQKDARSGGSNVVVINNTTNQTKGATVTPPRNIEVTSRVGA